MNWKISFFIALAALIGVCFWANNKISELEKKVAAEDTNICSGGMMSVALDTIDAHQRVKTYGHFLENMNKIREFGPEEDYGDMMIGEGNYAVTFGSVLESHQKVRGFRVENPCEFNTILKNASDVDSIYALLAIQEDPETKEGKLDLIYAYKTDRPGGSRDVNYKGYAFDDKHCDCPDDDCCPPPCLPTFCY